MRSAPPPEPVPTLIGRDLVIRTARLVLRPWRLDDVDAIWPVVSDPSFPRQMTWVAHADRAETVAFLEHTIAGTTAGNGVSWAITRDDAVIGNIAIGTIRWFLGALRVDRGEIGFWLAPAHQNKGYMTEAAGAAVAWLFGELGLHKITTGCHDTNPASRRVIEKTGFRFVGRYEDDVWRDGAWHSLLTYELTAADWRDTHTTLRVDRPTR
jgi:[ribosomal protein S5]-alanine N-acetyltransferase